MNLLSTVIVIFVVIYFQVSFRLTILILTFFNFIGIPC